MDTISKYGSENCRQEIEKRKMDKTNIILNCTSFQVKHLNESVKEENLKFILSESHQLLLILWNRRKNLKRNHGSKESRTSSKIKMGDGVCPTKGKINFHFKALKKNDEENVSNKSTMIQKENSENKKCKSIVPKYFSNPNLNLQMDDKSTYFKAKSKEQSEYLMSVIGAKSLIMIGQHIGWDGRKTVFRSGIARMTTLKGVTRMIVYTSDHEELLRCLYMCTSNALRRLCASVCFRSKCVFKTLMVLFSKTNSHNLQTRISFNFPSFLGSGICSLQNSS